MARRKIEMYEYKAIIYRLRQGMTARQIARDGLAGRNKVNQIRQVAIANDWLNKSCELPDEAILANLIESNITSKSSSKAEPFRNFIEQCVADNISAKVIHQRLQQQYGFDGAYNSIQRFVQQIKRKSSSNLTVPLFFEIGDTAQVDFGKGPRLYDNRIGKEVDTWFFVMTLSYSRHQYAEFITHQDVETWLRCHQNAFSFFGGVVKKVIIDNAKCAITKACYYDPKVQRSYESFAQDYGFIISACPPYDPQKKGRVESGVKYIKRNFLPLRKLNSLQHANEVLKKWIIEEAGMRTHGSTFKRPIKVFNNHEKITLQPLPSVLPEIATWHKVKLYRDCHVRHKYCCYSAPFELYDEELWLKATPTTISIYHQHKMVAHHARQFEKGAFSTKQEHLLPKAQYYLGRNKQWCVQKSVLIGENCALIIDDLVNHQIKDLLRQAQGILSLADTYGDIALEQACQRALFFDVYDYKTIRYILENGLENEIVTVDVQPEELTRSIYQGGARFQRMPQELIH